MQSPVRPLNVVVASELAKDSLEVTSAEDQEVVEALPARRPYPPLGKRVSLRCPDGRLDDLHTLGSEDLVEWTRVLRVSVSDQEPYAWKVLPYRQVPGLLGDPRRIRVPGDAEEVDPVGRENPASTRERRVVRQKEVPTMRDGFVSP